ncbi:MAG: OmpA family protein [Deltaproteobacteria bacterium]|nr:OmpA family protein [Deltaproteobacteria bacterium]
MALSASSSMAQSAAVTGLSQLTKDENIDLYPNAAKTEARIIFESEQDNIGSGGSNFEVILMGQDGIPKRLTTDEENNNNVAWLKDDVGVVFDSFRQKKRGLWIKSLRVGGDQLISRGKTVDFDADANPADGRIVFCAVEDEKDVKMRDDGERWYREFKNEMPHIWFVNPDGSGLTQLIKGINPVWSPDGARIAFASNVTGNYEIYTIKPDGSGLLQLTSRPDADIEPTWSPDGRKIAFVSNVNKDWNLWMMNADGTGMTQLTVEESHDGGPSWGKDGFIYFHSDRSGDYDIWRLKPSGYEVVPDDTDGDGVPDKTDKCPEQAEDKDDFQDEDGCPDLDNDNDGVPDENDKCPGEAETKNGFMDEDGCPDDNPLANGMTLYIDFVNDKQIKPTAFVQLDQVIEKLKQVSGKVEVRGYTAAVGSDARNMTITQNRADAVRQYFVERGIPGIA